MNAIEIGKQKITLEFSKDELGIIANALNEVCNGIEVWEFDTRMGISIEEARNMLKALTAIYRKADRQAQTNNEN